jgi:hypothetical protein
MIATATIIAITTGRSKLVLRALSRATCFLRLTQSRVPQTASAALRTSGNFPSRRTSRDRSQFRPRGAAAAGAATGATAPRSTAPVATPLARLAVLVAAVAHRRVAGALQQPGQGRIWSTLLIESHRHGDSRWETKRGERPVHVPAQPRSRLCVEARTPLPGRSWEVIPGAFRQASSRSRPYSRNARLSIQTGAPNKSWLLDRLRSFKCT